MLLRQMKYFLAVADCKSFSEAAEQCFISQSAISQQIKALEDELGVELILRSNRRFALTPAGEFFYQRAKSIVSESEKLKSNLYQMEHQQGQQIKLGCRNNYNVRRLCQALNLLLENDQNITISVVYGSHDELMGKLLCGELDVVFNDLRSESEQNNFICQPIEDVEGLVAVSQRSTLVPPTSTNSFIDLNDIKSMPCILIADKEFQEQEKMFYRRLFNFNGSFLIVKDMPSAITMLINNKGFMPIISNGDAREFTGKFARLMPLYNDGQPMRFKYCAFWNKAADDSMLKPIVQQIIELM